MNETIKAIIGLLAILYVVQVMMGLMAVSIGEVKTKKQFFRFLNPATLYTLGFQKFIETIQKIKKLP